MGREVLAAVSVQAPLAERPRRHLLHVLRIAVESRFTWTGGAFGTCAVSFSSCALDQVLAARFDRVLVLLNP
eukprot:1590772-Rhodomonas_salina.1